MQSANVQHPGHPPWTIDRLMGFVLAVSLTIGAARPLLVGINSEQIHDIIDQLIVSLLLAIFAGYCWDALWGGRGLLGSLVGGWIAGGLACFWLGGGATFAIGVAFATIPALCIGLLLSVFSGVIELGVRRARPRRNLVAHSSTLPPVSPGPTDAPR